MRLIKLYLERFRRFADEQRLDLNEDLIALVGPNEAGKSSVLDALETLNRGRSPSPSDTTRSMSGSATVRGLFLLEPDDHEALAGIRAADAITHAWVEHNADDGDEVWTLVPSPERDLGPRHRCAGLLAGLTDDPALDSQFSTNPEESWDPQLLENVVLHLRSREDSMSESAIAAGESLARRLRSLRYPVDTHGGADGSAPKIRAADRRRQERREAAASALVALAELERQPAPTDQAIGRLVGRLPTFVAFREEHRELRSDYPLVEVAANPPAALANLCALAGLDLVTLSRHVQDGAAPQVEKLLEKANASLKERFRGTWSQSKIYPRLSTPSADGMLRVFFSTEDELGYSYPQERSDGLRWFFALQAFLEAHGASRPILLVDEAETHLHYDAQADLIDVLMSQTVASKVIYTTHSVGCLPSDLGCAVRAVLPKDGCEQSRIVNSYWLADPQTDDRVGYGPLLFAMGARMLALTVPRYAVVVEGPSDAVLLPSLLREAAALSNLPYRVVPGLSQLTQERYAAIPDQAGRVVCLTDGDDGGKRACRRLIEAGVAPEAVFDLGRIVRKCTLEDLVRPEIFAGAVNTELETWGLSSWRVGESGVPRARRWSWLTAEGLRHGVPVDRLSKVRVAQRIVDAGRPCESGKVRHRRLSPATARRLRDLHSDICDALRIRGT